jgi:rod shape-determining protein MreD
MNLTPNQRSRLTIYGTFLAALVLTILPGPDWAEQFRPDWVALVLIYWVIAVPQRIGVMTGWTVGLILDVLVGSLLGQQALAKSVLAFIALKLHLRMRVYPRWQQAFSVLLLVALNHLIVLWIKQLTDQAPVNWTYWTSSIVSMLIWPWLFVILRDLRRHANVA